MRKNFKIVFGKNGLALIGLFSLLFALSACSGQGAKVVNLNAEEFSQKISDAAVKVIDVRTPGEFAAGHINGAINVDFESGNFSSEIQQLPRTGTYAVYCRSGNRSGQATEIMRKSGFTSVYNLSDGLISWMNSGKPVVTS